MATVNRIEYVRYTPEPHEDQADWKPVFIMRLHAEDERTSELREFAYDSELDDGTSFLDAFWPEYALRKGLGHFSMECYVNGMECSICLMSYYPGNMAMPSEIHKTTCHNITCYNCWTDMKRRGCFNCGNCNTNMSSMAHDYYEHLALAQRGDNA